MRAPLDIQNDALSYAGRSLHDLGLAGLLGGNLFGRLALHPAVTAISDKGERGQVVNAAWRRYGTVNSLSLAAVTSGWLIARLGESADRYLTPRERRLARIKDGLVATVAVTGLATAAEGVRFSNEAAGGAVPLEDGSHTAPEASRHATAIKRRLNALGTATVVAETALVVANAALAQSSFRTAPARRRLLRRS